MSHELSPFVVSESPDTTPHSASETGEGVVSGKLNFIDRISGAAGILAGVFLMLCALSIAYEIVLRSIFNKPTIWAFETSIYLFVLFVFMSLAYLQSRKRHIHVDLVVGRLCPHTKAIWDVVRMSFSLLFALILFVYGTRFAYSAFEIREISPSYWGPVIWPLKLVVPIGAFLLCLQYVKDIIAAVEKVLVVPLEKKAGLFNNPLFFGAVYSLLIVISFVLFDIEPISAFTLLLITMLLFGVDIFSALGLVGACGLFVVFGGPPVLITIPKVAYGSMNSFSVLCIPLFVMCGELLHRMGAGEELYDMASKWLGGLRGGLAIATVVACTVFAAISASSVATAMTIGLVALPALRAYGYSRPLSYGAVAAGGTLGIMIPPSGPMIIYSAVTEESLGKLFIAGVIPGIIIMALFCVYIMVYQWLFSKESSDGDAVVAVTTWKDRFYSIYNAKWALLTPIIIVGGIYAGIFTPMEAAAVAGLYSLVIMICRGKIDHRNFLVVIRDAVGSSTALIAIIFSAMIMGYFMTMLDLPNMVVNWVTESGFSRWQVIIMLMLGFFLMGMFLEVISIMMITLPIVYPLIIALGFDGIWFAVLMILNMEIALITPPVGLNLFVIQSIEESNLSTILRGVAPFFIIMILGLVIVAAFPILSTWLPNLMVQ